MKGDLNTLRKVCLYASKVMLAGEVVLAALILFTVAVGIGSVFSDTLGGLLDTVVGSLRGGSDGGDLPLVVETVLILVLGLVTVHIVHGFMDSITREHSPFTQGNVSRLKAASWLYLGASVLLLVVEYVASGSISGAVFLCLGCMMVCVVMYCLALVFRYGGVLQKESDETL